MRRRDSRSEGEALGGGASGRVAERGATEIALRPNSRSSAAGDAPQRLRLFIALDLPAAVRFGIDAWGREALADPALRRIGAAKLRITLAFLGNRPADEADPLIAAVRQIGEGASAPSISLRDVESLPSRRRPRVFVLAANSPETEIVQIGLRAALVDRDLYKSDGRRPFRPHVAVARVRPEGRGSRRPMAVRTVPAGRLPAPLLEPFHAESVGLYRSELHPSGARHRLLGKVDLRSSR